MASQISYTFSSSDIPLIDPKYDSLGYSRFAKTLADSICKLQSVEGLVISLNGPWGSGKSSVINFIKYYLNEKKDKNLSPYIISFNPWLFSGQEELISDFFNEILSEITHYHKLHTKLKKDIATLTSILSKGAKLIPVAGEPLKLVSAIASEQLSKKPSLQKTKNNIDEILRNETRKLIIFIDDIDRLSAIEIRHLFGAIKSIANFPNVLYVLAFDEEVVCNALNKTQEMDGKSYLDKIVQIPFKLPLPDQNGLGKLFSHNLNDVFKNTKEEYIDLDRWHNFYNNYFNFYLQTPRSIIRFLNTLKVTYSSVENEVDVVDFVAVEMLRVFLPSIYDIVSHNESWFVLDNTKLGVLMNFNVVKIKDYHEHWIKNVEEKDKQPVEYCITNLFPKVANVLSGNNPSDDLRSWRRYLRVCCPSHFHKYFRFSVSTESISNVVFQNFVANLQDKIFIKRTLLTLLEEKLSDGTSRAAQYLEYLCDCIDDKISEEDAVSLATVLFDVGDKLSIETDCSQTLGAIGNEQRIRWILYPCIKRLPDIERFKLHKDIFANANGLSTIVFWFDSLCDEYDKNMEDQLKEETDALLTESQLESLKPVVLKRIKMAAKDYSILDQRYFSLVLHVWDKLEGIKTVQSFINKAIKDDACLLKFVHGFSSYNRYGGEGSIVAKKKLRIRLEWMKDFINVDDLYQRVKKVKKLPKSIDHELRLSFEQFKKEYEALRDGKSLREFE